MALVLRPVSSLATPTAITAAVTSTAEDAADAAASAAAAEATAANLPGTVGPLVAEAIASDPDFSEAAEVAVSAKVVELGVPTIVQSDDPSTDLTTAITDSAGKNNLIAWNELNEVSRLKITTAVRTYLQQGSLSVNTGSDSPGSIEITDESGRFVLIGFDDTYAVDRVRFTQRARDSMFAVARPTIRPLPTATETQMLAIMNLCARYQLNTWMPSQAAAWGAVPYAFGGDWQDKIRPPAMCAHGLGVLLASGAYNATVTGVSEASARTQCRDLIASLLQRHKANGGTWGGNEPPWAETDDTSTGDPSWQTAMWAFLTASAGWLTWVDLNTTDRTQLVAMVVWEANRFLKYRPKFWRAPDGTVNAGYSGDSKSEEMMWNTQIISLALAVDPQNANATGWTAKLIEMAAASTALQAENTSEENVHGTAVRDLINGFNIQDNGSMVNHGIVHPGYTRSVSSLLAGASVIAVAGKRVPAALFRNVPLMYWSVTDYAWPTPPNLAPGGPSYKSDGTIYYPQGSDWGLSRIVDMAQFDVMVAVYGVDTQSTQPATYWAGLHLAAVAAQQARGTDGAIYQAGDDEIYTWRENLAFGQLATAYLAVLAGKGSRPPISNAHPTMLASQNRNIG